jgi:hypothetical protein
MLADKAASTGGETTTRQAGEKAIFTGRRLPPEKNNAYSPFVIID